MVSPLRDVLTGYDTCSATWRQPGPASLPSLPAYTASRL
ncbi:hypothetical protein LTSEMIN_1577, partial [Salmonella enterica subsp. enterica serovar Minnesota str. A4-603]